jgi:hypothetical protein
MKRLFFLFCLIAGFMYVSPPEANAQLTATLMTKGAAGDTAIINTSTPTMTTTVLEGRSVVSIQVSITKWSGTIAGKAELQGSLNGVDYVRIAADTLKLNNNGAAGSVQTYIWTVTPGKYYSYRVKCTGVGTMNARCRSWLLKRKDE